MHSDADVVPDENASFATENAKLSPSRRGCIIDLGNSATYGTTEGNLEHWRVCHTGPNSISQAPPRDTRTARLQTAITVGPAFPRGRFPTSLCRVVEARVAVGKTPRLSLGHDESP